MTRTEAEALAQQVAETTGHHAHVEYEVDLGEFAVLVDIAQPRSGAVREEFRLGDELDWEWLRKRITSA